jgi:hypothetical protein
MNLIEEKTIENDRKEIFQEYCIQLKEIFKETRWNIKELIDIMKNIEKAVIILISQYEDTTNNKFNLKKEEYIGLIKISQTFKEETKSLFKKYFFSNIEYINFISTNLKVLNKHFTNSDNYIGFFFFI